MVPIKQTTNARTCNKTTSKAVTILKLQTSPNETHSQVLQQKSGTEYFPGFPTSVYLTVHREKYGLFGDV